MKRYRFPVIFIAFALMQSCTDFQEEEIPDTFGVNTNELSFLKEGDTRSLNVSSGSRWDITSMPGWISLGKISRSGMSTYEWTVDFSASANDEYDRDGEIVFTAQSDTKVITVTQEGKKGKYIAVESVTVSPTELTLTEGENASLSFEIIPSNASVKEVTWKSSNTAIATVSQDGQVDAIVEGSAVITVTTEDGNKTASCTVTVNPVSVSSVSLDKESLTLKIGESSTLLATVLPENAANKKVTWSSSNSNVATVDSKGTVTGIGVGSAKITVSTEDGGKTATCTVMVDSISVTGVSLNKTSMSLVIGGAEQLTATVTPSNATNKKVTWSSSNSNVATVDSNGNVMAIKVGSAVITVKTEDGGKTATCSVTVNPISVTGVSLNETSLTMNVGDTQALTATVVPSNATDKSVTWSSSNTSVATVSSSGVVTAKAAGSATITVTTNDGGKKATCSITVVRTPLSSPQGVIATLDADIPNAIEVVWDVVSGAAYYEVTATPASGYVVTLQAYSESATFTDLAYETTYTISVVACPTDRKYTKSDPSDPVTVTTGIRKGTLSNPYTVAEAIAAVKAAGKDVKIDDVHVTGIVSQISEISTEHGYATYFISDDGTTGAQFRISRGYYLEGANFTSQDQLQVGDKVTVLGSILWYQGETPEMANGGKLVSLGRLEVHVTGVTLNKTSLSLAVGDTETLIPTVLPSNASNKAVYWASSNHSIAAVDINSGVITAKSPGNATITVITYDGAETATCAVSVKEASSISIPEAVDLGLSVKWASFNLGANKPEEYGNYYAWGETEPKVDYSWSTYKWSKNGTYNSLTKYCSNAQYGSNGFTDGKKKLDIEDDAARVNLGDSWRMPTTVEVKELLESSITTISWTTVNGVKGMRITSKTTNNSILLPAAGNCKGESFVSQGNTGFYVSSVLPADDIHAWLYLLASTSVTVSTDRCYGFTIRPVYVE